MSKIKSQLLFSDLTGGLNTTYDKENINSTTKKTETPDMVNVEYFKLGGIKTMDGNIKVGVNDNSIQESAVVGGWEYTQGDKRYMMIGLENGEVRIYEPSIDNNNVNENPFVLLYKFPSTSKRMSFCNMNNGVVITNGIDDLVFYDRGSGKTFRGSVSYVNGENEIIGIGTDFFNDVEVGQTIKIGGCKSVYVVKEIYSETKLRVEPKIEANDYNTYYKWKSDNTSSYNIIMELPDGNVDEVPEFMPSVIEISDVEGGGDYFNLKHFYGVNDYVSYNDIKSPFIIQTGRLCRVNYSNNTTSFISDNPSDAVNNCLEATPDGVFIDTNGIIYRVNSDNTFNRIGTESPNYSSSKIISLKDNYAIDEDYNLYEIYNNDLYLIDTDCKKLFRNYGDKCVFYIKEVDNNLKLYYHGYYNPREGTDTGPVKDGSEASDVIVNSIDDINVTSGLTFEDYSITMPMVSIENNISYIRLSIDPMFPDKVEVVLVHTGETCIDGNLITGCIGYKKESDSTGYHHKLYSSTYINGNDPDHPNGGKPRGLTIDYTDHPTYDFMVPLDMNIQVVVKELEDNVYLYKPAEPTYSYHMLGQSYNDIITEKKHYSYFSQYIDFNNYAIYLLNCGIDSTYTGAYDVIQSWARNFNEYTLPYIDGFYENNPGSAEEIDIVNFFITGDQTNWVHQEVQRHDDYWYTLYFDDPLELHNYFSLQDVHDNYNKHLSCYQDNNKYVIRSSQTPYVLITDEFNNTLLNQYNLEMSDSFSGNIEYPVHISYTTSNGNSNIYTTIKSKDAIDIYKEPSSDTLITVPHEPYEYSKIKVYGNESAPSIQNLGTKTIIRDLAESGIYELEPLVEVKNFNEEPSHYDVPYGISDVQVLNAVVTNSKPDVATGGDVHVPVRGLAIQYYNGRLWVGGETGLFYSAVGLPNNWDIHSDAGVIYDLYNDSSPVKALGLFSEYLMVHKEFSTYILTCNGSAETINIRPFSNITCESQQSWIVSNTKYFVYSKDFMDIYPLVQHTVFNDKFLGEPITQKVRSIFKSVRIEDTDRIFCVSRPRERQMIFYLPTYDIDGSNYALIFDFQTKSFLLRMLPKESKVSCVFNYDNNVYIGTKDGLVLKEFTGPTFTALDSDKNVISLGLNAYYKTPWFDWVGGYTQSFAEFMVELDSEHNNHFFIRTQKDGQSRYEDREIDLDKVNRNSKSLIWADDTGPEDSKWDEKNWSKLSFENIRMLLPNNVFEDFQVEFRAIKPGEHFCIYQYGFRRIETEEDPW